MTQQREDASSDYELEHPQEANASHEVIRAFNDQMAVYEHYARSKGLHGKALDILLWMYYTDGPITQRFICSRTYATKQVVNMTLKGWRNNGWVEEVEHLGGDGRERRLRLTEEGRRMAKEILDPLRNAEISAIEVIDPEMRQAFAAMSTAYVKALKQELHIGKDND